MKLTDLFEARDRDPDWEYDNRRQEELDDEYEKNNTFKTTYRVYDGVTKEYVSDSFDTQAEAVTARSKITKNAQHLSIQSAKAKVK